MRLYTTGRAAWIVAAGMWASAALCPTTDAQAQTAAQAPDQATAIGSATGVAAEIAPPTRLHPKTSASKPRKTQRQARAKKSTKQEAAKAAESKTDEAKVDTSKADTSKAAEAKVDVGKSGQPHSDQGSSISPAIANANAQWPSDAKPTDNYNTSTQAGNVLSKMEAKPEQATPPAADSAGASEIVAPDQLNELDRAAEDKPALTLAKATIDTPPANAAAATAENNTPWEQTSVIGKIFIALGGVLTLASAARMFMA
ncbi:MAG: hypothetical protein NT113_03070 [Hyphomicrobiales bacterium]|nr:hypothetical protein [Hyphomicrobiales bacterium]